MSFFAGRFFGCFGVTECFFIFRIFFGVTEYFFIFVFLCFFVGPSRRTTTAEEFATLPLFRCEHSRAAPRHSAMSTPEEAYAKLMAMGATITIKRRGDIMEQAADMVEAAEAAEAGAARTTPAGAPPKTFNSRKVCMAASKTCPEPAAPLSGNVPPSGRLTLMPLSTFDACAEHLARLERLQCTEVIVRFGIAACKEWCERMKPKEFKRTMADGMRGLVDVVVTTEDILNARERNLFLHGQVYVSHVVEIGTPDTHQDTWFMPAWMPEHVRGRVLCGQSLLNDARLLTSPSKISVHD